MAIFAKKKHGRRNENMMDGAGQRDSVAIEVGESGPAGLASNDTGVSDAASNDTGSEATAATAVSANTPTPGVADADDGTVAGAPEATAAAGLTKVSAAGGATPTGTTATDADPIEPVDIEPEEVAPARAFGIADAIRLMRSLPADPNIDLVVRVVRVTLSAVNVSVEEIMQDAERKEQRVRDSIAKLETEVSDLEKQLHDKRAAITAHQADLRETATVRERLHMADKYTPHPPPLPPGAARVPLPKPREWESFDSDTPFKDS